MNLSSLFQRHLQRQLKQVTSRLEKIERDELLLTEAVWRTGGVGMYALEDSARTIRLVAKNESLKLLKNTQITLQKIKQGTYGICEKCARQIEVERLKILPATTFCVRCK